MRVVASPREHEIVTTRPEEVLKREEEARKIVESQSTPQQGKPEIRYMTPDTKQ